MYMTVMCTVTRSTGIAVLQLKSSRSCFKFPLQVPRENTAHRDAKLEVQSNGLFSSCMKATKSMPALAKNT